MFKNKKILAIVPARSGSKGVPGKNMRKVGGISLIGRAGLCLKKLPWIDFRILSTDSEVYAREGLEYGLDVPFLRDERLSTDSASTVDVVRDLLFKLEAEHGCRVDYILIVEPTSPLRLPEDIEAAMEMCIGKSHDSVVSVSVCDPKFHPKKLLTVEDGALGFLEADGAKVVARQELSTLYYRNGAVYVVARGLLVNEGKIIGKNSGAYVIQRPMINIDFEHELEYADFLLSKRID